MRLSSAFNITEIFIGFPPHLIKSFRNNKKKRERERNRNNW